MESAQLLIAGLETSSVSEERRDEYFRNFCNLVDFFHKTKVKLEKEKGIETHNFSFGMIWEFVCGSWADFVVKDSLKGISQTSYEMFAPILMQHPSLGAEITNIEWERREHPKTSYGLCPDAAENNYIADTLSWQKKRAEYYAAHQTMYAWNETDDSFLPNRLLSDKILEREIEKHGYMEEYQTEKSRRSSNALSIVFHNKVMRGKGNALAAYTEEIGKEVCEANYYQYEEILSRNERRAAHNSLRSIYSMINRDGNKQYISLDFRHGMMEFHNEHGDHLGEFQFTGMRNAEADPSHNFRTL